MARRPWLLRAAAAAAVCVLLGGCSDDEIGGDEIPLAKGESLGELRQQAREALVRYDKAVAAAGPGRAVDVSQPPWDPGNPSSGTAIDAAKTSRTGTQLTVTFLGAPGPATEPCGADYYAEAVESAEAVVVIVIAQPHAANEICPLVGYTRTATLNLARPLGDRAVLEVREGQRVDVDPTPVTG